MNTGESVEFGDCRNVFLTYILCIYLIIYLTWKRTRCRTSKPLVLFIKILGYFVTSYMLCITIVKPVE